MEYYDRELKIFDKELNNNFQKIFNDNRSRVHLSHQKYIRNLRSQASNGIALGTEYMDLNNQSDVQHHGMDIQADGNTLPSPGGYPQMDFSFSFDSKVGVTAREELDTRRNQSLDDFFQDFNEIFSSEMKTTTPYDTGHHRISTSATPYSDQSNCFNSTAGVDFNLDLTQFYINTNESDFLNSDDVKTDFSNGLVHYPPTAQFTYQDDSPAYSVIDLSTCDTKMHLDIKQNSTGQNAETFDRQQEFSVLDLSNQQNQVVDYTDTKISVSTPLEHFYLDYLNGDAANATNVVDNSVVTYISKDALQSVEYINESGQTETVMYVDQQSNGEQDDNSGGGGITQYEIIDFDDYQTENVDSQQHTNNDALVPNFNSLQYYGGESQDVVQQTDILTTLLSDKNNKITLISKPMKHPKIRQTADDIMQLQMEEINNNSTNIVFAKRSTVKGGRKQKLETINQIDLDVVETKRNRSKAKKTSLPIIAATPTATRMTFIPERKILETPKLPSKFMRDRRSKMQVKRKRPRKLFWDSESDCENVEQLVDESNN